MRLFGGCVIVSSVPRWFEGNDMTEVHRTALSTRHAALDAALSREALKPLPDSLQMARLKKEKLRLKEKLSHG